MLVSVSVRRLLFTDFMIDTQKHIEQGGALTHFQLLSSESREYFRNAIVMSGLATAYWAMSEHNDHLKVVQNVAKSAGKIITNTNELLKYLLSESHENLIEHTSTKQYYRTFTLPYTPVIESEFKFSIFFGGDFSIFFFSYKRTRCRETIYDKIRTGNL